jgi:hypothetical protein
MLLDTALLDGARREVAFMIQATIPNEHTTDSVSFTMRHLVHIIRSDRAAMFLAQDLCRILGSTIVVDILFFLHGYSSWVSIYKSASFLFSIEHSGCTDKMAKGWLDKAKKWLTFMA